MVDADIILSENQWRGECPHKILDTHYRFESCPDYKNQKINKIYEKSK